MGISEQWNKFCSSDSIVSEGWQHGCIVMLARQDTGQLSMVPCAYIIYNAMNLNFLLTAISL